MSNDLLRKCKEAIESAVDCEMGTPEEFSITEDFRITSKYLPNDSWSLEDFLEDIYCHKNDC